MRDEPGAAAECSWRPWPGRRWCYAAGAVAALILALRSEGGAFSAGTGIAFTVVAVVLALLAGLDLWFGTPLSADATGLRVRRGPGRTTTIPWSTIDRIEAASATSRGLLRVTSLEIDVGEQLLVLTRHRLGSDPEEVADELRRRWPNSPPPLPP